jgi:hypothetical protein
MGNRQSIALFEHGVCGGKFGGCWVIAITMTAILILPRIGSVPKAFGGAVMTDIESYTTV